MQEAYLTGADGTDATPVVVEATQAYFNFSSLALTDEFNLTLVGYRHADDVHCWLCNERRSVDLGAVF